MPSSLSFLFLASIRLRLRLFPAWTSLSFHRLLLLQRNRLIVELRASQTNRLLDNLSRRLEVLPLFELHLPLHFFAFNVGNQERRHQVSDVGVGPVVLLFGLVQKLVDRFDLQLGLFECLHR